MLRDLDQRQQATSQLPMGESYENKQATEVIKGLSALGKHSLLQLFPLEKLV